MLVIVAIDRFLLGISPGLPKKKKKRKKEKRPTAPITALHVLCRGRNFEQNGETS